MRQSEEVWVEGVTGQQDSNAEEDEEENQEELAGPSTGQKRTSANLVMQ
jgi:hypothetical protein